jgi:hypothetical protein
MKFSQSTCQYQAPGRIHVPAPWLSIEGEQRGSTTRALGCFSIVFPLVNACFPYNFVVPPLTFRILVPQNFRTWNRTSTTVANLLGIMI